MHPPLKRRVRQMAAGARQTDVARVQLSPTLLGRYGLCMQRLTCAQHSQHPRTTVADPAAGLAKNLLLGQPAPSVPEL